MAFYIQDPSYHKSSYLHEALITACVGGISGGGAYAFASKDGIKLLFEDENFIQFLRNGEFMLIVGMDDITNTYSLDTLKKLQEKYDGRLKVKAYIHNSKGSTFHPKYSWFVNADGGVLVLGSGNLTQKGLRQNREAYAIEKCDKSEIEKIINEWEEWVKHSKPFLFDIDEAIVYEYAKQNTCRMKAIVNLQKQVDVSVDVNRLRTYVELLQGQPIDIKTNTSSIKPESEGANTEKDVEFIIYDEDLDIDLPYWTIFLNSEALIAEIPKSGNRWQQVNFDKRTFENFFGATCGENGIYRILFRNMSHNGILNEVEVRPSVSVSSQNYRFELDGAKGMDYPEGNDRPLGIFVKVSPRDFMYEMVMPGDEAYNACIEVLNNKEVYSVNRMRRIRYLCKEIFERIPQLALWKRLDVEEDE